MEYRLLGETGMKVFHMGLGASALGGVYGETDLEELCQVVRQALEGGVNYLDTAPWYGQGKSEEVLGKALEGIPRSSYYLATKVGRYDLEADKMFDFSAERTLKSVDDSLKKLGVDYVDVIQVHDMEFAPSLDIIINETLPALQKVKDAGKARFIGITGYPLENFKKVIERSSVKIDTILSYCHLSMHDSSLLHHLDYFKEKGIGVINAAPISMGLLTHQSPPEWHPATNPIRDACLNAAQLCEDRGVNLSRLAIKYSYSFTQIPTTLVSTSSVDTLHRNLDTLRSQLSPLEQSTMEEVMERFMRPLANMTWEKEEMEDFLKTLEEAKRSK